MTVEEAILRRIRTRAAAIGVLAAGGAFLWGWRAGVSLTICAAVVILSFLVLETLTDRLVPPQEKKGWKALWPILLVTVGGLVLLGLALRWEAFDSIAGLVGLSVVVVAIGAEVFKRGG